MIKAIIFDCFGVVRPDNLRLTYQRFGGNLDTEEQFITDTISAANHGLIPNSRDVFAKKLGITGDEFMQALDDGVQNDQRLLDYIAELRKTYKTGMLSNVSRGRLQEIFEPGVLDKYFDVYVGSGDIGVAKPEPEAYRTVAERLGVSPEECIFTDDSEDYCAGARAAGMQAIRYQSFPQYQRDLEAIFNTAKS